MPVAGPLPVAVGVLPLAVPLVLVPKPRAAPTLAPLWLTVIVLFINPR
jgi:hypothetical protein